MLPVIWLSHIICTVALTLVLFQNEGIFIQLDELDEFDKITCAWITMHLQSLSNPENVLV